MRKINKGTEPDSLSNWKRQNPQKRYADLQGSNIKQDIRIACTIEQYYLCAYCCKRISGSPEDTMNEHVEPQHHAPNRTLDFTNIVASCTTKGQCDDAHGSDILPLTPLMDECETEFEFRLNGEMIGLTDRAQQSIEILKLNNEKLTATRKQIITDILYLTGLGQPIEIDDELILEVVNDFYQPDTAGKMPAFAPIIANAIKNWINQK